MLWLVYITLTFHCACGKAFSVSHALNCPHSVFPISRHNDVRDLIAKLMSDVCHDIQVEPHLHPLSNKSLHHKSAVHEDDARVELVLELPASGAVITVVLFLMLEYSTLLLTVTFLLVQQQLYKDMRVKM